MPVKKSIFAILSPELLKKRKKAPQPAFIEPMLATLTKDYFSQPDWIYEHKFDGVRCLAFKKNGKVTLYTRNHINVNGEYPEIATALTKQTADNFVIDGEIISKNKKGVSDFQQLQGRINLRNAEKLSTKEKEIQLTYCIFDLMYVDGYDIQELPLYARKELLKKLLTYNTTLSYTDHEKGDGLTAFKRACALKWEGLIAKYSDSEYVGRRSKQWLKFKCIMKQELVIGGYTQPKGSRSYFGALLVGYYDKGAFKYAGKVGTGFSQETLELLGQKLLKLHTKTCPFSDYDESTTGVVWVKPMLVAEFQFAQWTNAGRLRVGRYKGLREDKAAKDVVKELPKAIGPTK